MQRRYNTRLSPQVQVRQWGQRRDCEHRGALALPQVSLRSLAVQRMLAGRRKCVRERWHVDVVADRHFEYAPQVRRGEAITMARACFFLLKK